jgi:hypothetical protein
MRFEGKLLSDELFGRLGWALFISTLISVIVTALILPYIMAGLHLVFPAEWVVATRFVVQIAFGSWVGTVVVSIARIIIWLRAMFQFTTMEQYLDERRQVTYVRDFNLWLFGIMTALAAYMTVWVSEG